MENPRYIVKKDSQHTCCMEASVVDTQAAEGETDIICETYTPEMAEAICVALNASPMRVFIDYK